MSGSIKQQTALDPKIMHKIKDVMDRIFPKILDELQALSKIPSVSFPGFPKEEVARSAQAVSSLFKKYGLKNVEILELAGSPYIFGEETGHKNRPTLLLYAHHDVQPPGREEFWKTPPFEPTKVLGAGGERLYGRGTADDKAGILMHLAAIAATREVLGELPVNVKLLVEGEEEIGSPHLHEFLEKYRKRCDADVLVLTDCGNFDCGIPALTIALRGLVELGIELRALTKSIHSGVWGGPIPDPAMALCKVLAQLVDAQGRVALPGIRKQVRPLTALEEKDLRQIPFDEKEFRKQAGLVPSAQLLKEGPHPLGQTWHFPSLTVNALQASSRAQAGNIINDVAWAKVTLRVSKGMDPKACSDELQSFIRAKVPWGLECKIEEETASPAWFTEPQGPVFEAAVRALEAAYDKPLIRLGSGGTIPFVGPFAEALGGTPALLVGVEDPYTNAHGENESLLISDFYKGCLGEAFLFLELGQSQV